MKTEDCYELGAIVKTHGLKGEVLAMLDTDEPESYEGLDSVFVEIKGKLVPFFIKNINIQQSKAIIKFEDIDRLEQAQPLVHCKLHLPLDVLPQAEEGKFYLHEVLNYTVIDDKLGKLGVITNLYEGATQDILGMTYQGKEVLFPAVDEIVLSINRETQEIAVAIPEGLVDLYLNEEEANKRDE
jgi:16S rRNA processing protein RimM